MNAQHIVNLLVEDDDALDDVLQDLEPRTVPEKVKASIEEYLMDRGWCTLRLNGGAGEETWEVVGTFIDNEHRAYWMNAGARAIGAPELDTQKVSAFATFASNTFRAAMKRAGWQISNVRRESVDTIYDVLDLEGEEAMNGDVAVTLSFNFIHWTTT